MDDLMQFLRKQLDREAAAAQYVMDHSAELPDQLRSAAERVKDAYGDPEPPEDEVSPADRLWWLSKDAADWIEQYGPTRMLREIDAKRDLLVFAKGVHDHHETFTTGVYARLEKTLRLYALAYKDRPGYRETWRP